MKQNGDASVFLVGNESRERCLFRERLQEPMGFFILFSHGASDHSFADYHDREESTGRCINGQLKSPVCESNALKIAKRKGRGRNSDGFYPTLLSCSH